VPAPLGATGLREDDALSDLQVHRLDGRQKVRPMRGEEAQKASRHFQALALSRKL
jgi:hypothetical protein